MNDHEIERIADALHRLRPDWPVKQLRTLLASDKLATRPRRDVTVALAWVACESGTANPYRVLEAGPWWKAAAIEGDTTPRNPYDLERACGICDQPEERCTANPHAGHEYVRKPDALRARIPGEHAPAIVGDLRDRLAKSQHIDQPETEVPASPLRPSEAAAPTSADRRAREESA